MKITILKKNLSETALEDVAKDFRLENYLVETMSNLSGRKIHNTRIAEALDISIKENEKMEITEKTLPLLVANNITNPVVLTAVCRKHGMNDELEQIAEAYSKFTEVLNRIGNNMKAEVEVEFENAFGTFKRICK